MKIDSKGGAIPALAPNDPNPNPLVNNANDPNNPPPVEEDAGFYGTLSAMLSSLDDIIPPEALGNGDIEITIAQLQQKLRDLVSASDMETIKLENEKRRDLLKEKMRAAEEALRKMREAAAQRENQSIWDKIKLAFMAIAAVAALIVGVATGNPALITAGVIGLTLVVDDIVKQNSPNGLGIAGNLAKLGGMSDEDAKKADMGFSIALIVLSLAAAASGGVAAAINGIKTALKEGLKAGLKNMKEFGKEVGEEIAGDLISKYAEAVGKTLTGLSEIGVAVSAVGSGATGYLATLAEADNLKTQGKQQELEALLKQMDDLVDMLLQHMMKMYQTFDKVLESLVEAVKDKGDTFSRAHVA